MSIINVNDAYISSLTSTVNSISLSDIHLDLDNNVSSSIITYIDTFNVTNNNNETESGILDTYPAQSVTLDLTLDAIKLIINIDNIKTYLNTLLNVQVKANYSSYIYKYNPNTNSSTNNNNLTSNINLFGSESKSYTSFGSTLLGNYSYIAKNSISSIGAGSNIKLNDGFSVAIGTSCSAGGGSWLDPAATSSPLFPAYNPTLYTSIIDTSSYKSTTTISQFSTCSLIDGTTIFGNVSIGAFAGQTGQGNHAIAVGFGAGNFNQSPMSIARGLEAGKGIPANNKYLGVGAIADGAFAMRNGSGSFAIGYGFKANTNSDLSTIAPANSMVFNSSGVYQYATAGAIILAADPSTPIVGSTAGFYVAPVRQTETLETNPDGITNRYCLLAQDPLTGEIVKTNSYISYDNLNDSNASRMFLKVDKNDIGHSDCIVSFDTTSGELEYNDRTITNLNGTSFGLKPVGAGVEPVKTNINGNAFSQKDIDSLLLTQTGIEVSGLIALSAVAGLAYPISVGTSTLASLIETSSTKLGGIYSSVAKIGRQAYRKLPYSYANKLLLRGVNDKYNTIDNSINIGYNAGQYFMMKNAIAVGNSSGKYNAPDDSVSIGNYASAYNDYYPTEYIIGTSVGIYMTGDDLTTYSSKSSLLNVSDMIFIEGYGYIAVGTKISTGTSAIMTSTDGKTWISNTCTLLNTAKSVCFNGIKVVVSGAVASPNTSSLIYSELCVREPAGNLELSTWTACTTHFSSAPDCISWSDEYQMFTAVSSSTTGNISNFAYSYDGKEWLHTYYASGTSTTAANIDTKLQEIYSICSNTYVEDSDLIFVCVGSNNIDTESIAYSKDCTEWTSPDDIPIGITCKSVCYSPQLGLFITIGEIGSGSSVSGFRIYKSSNGISWSEVTRPSFFENATTYSSLNKIYWSGNLFVISATCKDTVVINYPSIITSPDGITWTQNNNTLFSNVKCVISNINYSVSTVSIGNKSGQNFKKSYTISIGDYAGQNNQGTNSIAIGNLAGVDNQHENTIILNASGSDLNSSSSDGFFVDPVRGVRNESDKTVYYNSNTKEITFYDGVDRIGRSLPVGENYGDYMYWDADTGYWKVGNTNIVLGANAGQINQKTGAIAIGVQAGQNNQGTNSIAIGNKAGVNSQATGSIILNATGLVLDTTKAGFYVSPINNTSISTNVVFYNSTTKELVYNASYVGGGSGGTNLPNGINYGDYLYWNSSAWVSESYNIKLGGNSGKNAQGGNAVAIGNSAGNNSQGISAVAIGSFAGQSGQGISAVAIGNQSGQSGQGTNAIAIGTNAGASTQGSYGVAIGTNAGSTTQGQYAVAIGTQAGQISQGFAAFALGLNAGQYNQSTGAVAIGNFAGNNKQGFAAVALGNYAGITGQGTNAVAIGNFAGSSGQKQNAVSIGVNAGQNNQGTNSIAIGNNAGVNNQATGSIILNATGLVLNTTNSGFYVKPIRNINLASSTLVYNTTTGEIGYDNSGTGGNLSDGTNYGDYLYWNSITLEWTTGNTNISLGSNAGATNQGSYAVAVGAEAGSNSQGESAVSIGNMAGTSTQGINAVAIGINAGSNNQRQYAVAIGSNSGTTTQGQNAVAIGSDAGSKTQGEYAVAIGPGAGTSTQGSYAVSIGSAAGSNSQGNFAVAIGAVSGNNLQGQNAVSIGYNAGNSKQGSSAVAIGYNAGQNTQGTNAISIGNNAGQNTQGESAVSIGYNAGQNTQGSNAIAIGNLTGSNSQGQFAVAIGYDTGNSKQGQSAVAIGALSGEIYQGQFAVAIGALSGKNTQGDYAVAIGNYAGNSKQGSSAIAIGNSAGQTNQGSGAIAIGNNAGQNTQGESAVSIGYNTGSYSQGSYAIAIGYNTGSSGQGTNSVAIGFKSGNLAQGSLTVAIGNGSGETKQGTGAIAIGSFAGRSTQGQNAVAIGNGAGQTKQGINAIAIGFQAGQTTQGNYSIAIGANSTSTHNNSIVLNATSTQLNSTVINGLFVKPIRNLNLTTALVYNASSGEISYATSGVKTFVIDHPVDENKYLVHACLEGPEAGVYYRGKGEITNNESIIINLPEYVDKLAKNFTVQITPINKGVKRTEILDVSEVENNSFTVYGNNTKFFWSVYGERNSIITEPNKKDVNVRGDGPYKYIY